MFIRFGFRALFLILISLLTFACGPAQSSTSSSTPVAPAPTLAPTTTLAPTAAPTTQSPTATKADSLGSPNDVIRLAVVNGASEARYRVREQLAGVSLPSDAIGKTKAVTGEIVGKPDGTIVSSESKFVVDLRSLQSDRSQRDNFLRRSVLETDQYPNAVFVPTGAQGLNPSFPPAGEQSFKLVGDLTVRNVTKPVTWDVTCQPQGNQGTCHATTSFDFEYVGLTPPRVPVVLSVEDHITLELDLVLARQ